MTDDKPRFELNWVQASAASLAAVTSAVLLSTFGVAGTLIGAAVGSLALTVGNAVYSYSINATKTRVATAQSAAAARIGLARARAEDGAAGEGDATSATARTSHGPAAMRGDPDRSEPGHQDADADPPSGGWRITVAALPWRRIAVVSTGVFVAAVLLIVAFELIAGRSVSSFTGSDDRRTSIPGWGDRSEPEEPAPQDKDAPADEAPRAPDERDVLVPTADSTPPPSPTETADSSPDSVEPSPNSVEPSPNSVESSTPEPSPSR